MESRGSADDKRDVEMTNNLRASLVLPTNFRVAHVPGAEEPLLWAADAICGAYSAARVGNARWMLKIDHNIPGDSVSTYEDWTYERYGPIPDVY